MTDVTIGDVLGFACRASIVPVLAVAAAAALHRASAAVRHGVLAAGLVSTLVFAPAAVVVPSWGLLTPAADAALDEAPAPAIRADAAVAITPAVAASRHTEAPGGSGETVTSGASGGRGIAEDVGRTAVVLWLAGFVLGLSRLGIAGLALRRLTARAERLTQGSWVDATTHVAHQQGYAGRLDVYASPSVAAPATFGVLRPAVIVPERARTWREARVRAVLRHEMAHVVRRDWLVHIVADVAVALHWFNPLVHLMRARLQRESEQACDDAVLAAGTSPREYAGHLLAIARAGRLAAAPAAAVPMATPSTLEGRIAAMLSPDLDRRVPSRRTAFGITLVLLAITFTLAGLGLYAQAGPASVAGVVYDPSGAVLPAVEVTLEDERLLKFSAVTDASGRFEFGPLDAGDYQLEATLAGFRPVRLSLTLAPGRAWNRALTMNVGRLQETITVTARRPSAVRQPEPAVGTPVRVGGNIKPPMKVLHVPPVYPESLREAGLEGTVPLEALIGVDGRVVSVRAVSADVHPAFLKAATDAVQQWRFTSTLLNGAPVEVAMEVSIRFGLSD